MKLKNLLLLASSSLILFASPTLVSANQENLQTVVSDENEQTKTTIETRLVNGEYQFLLTVHSLPGVRSIRADLIENERQTTPLTFYKQADGSYLATLKQGNVLSSEFLIYSEITTDIGQTYHFRPAYFKVNQGLTTQPTTPSGTITVQQVNHQEGWFDIVVSNVTSPKGVSAVKIPVWSEEAGQDDIVWYTALKQNDGTYRLRVSSSNHKQSRGLYHAHLYLSQNDQTLVGVGGTTTQLNSVPSTDTTTAVPTGQINIQNLNQQNGTFEVVISNVNNPNGLRAVKVPIWSEQAGQDDIIWYDATRQADGTYKVLVEASRHKQSRGVYHVHLYYLGTNNKLTAVGAASAKLEETTAVPTGQINIQNLNQQNGTFEVVISNVNNPSGLRAVKVPIWSEQAGQDDIIWYDATRQADGTYKVLVEASRHKQSRGVYHVHLYYLGTNNKLTAVGAASAKLEETTGNSSGMLSVSQRSNGQFEVTLSNVSHPAGVKQVLIPVWSEQAGQDDIIWYDATRQADGTYKVLVEASRHQYNQGTYHVHAYLKDSTGKLHGVAATSTTVKFSNSQPSAHLAIQNVDNTFGIFDVVVSNIYVPTGIEKVSVPVWSEKNGQNDIRWYEAIKQNDGTYRITINIANHNYETGLYHAHLYITTQGQQKGLAATSAYVNYTQQAHSSFIDVSSHNGHLSVDNYRNLLTQGVKGVVVKLTEGTHYTNPYAGEQIRNAQTAGLKVSVYHYSHFTDAQTAQAEAQYFVAAARRFGLHQNTVMVNDIEEQKTKNNINQNMKYWEAEMRRLGYSNLVHYAGASWIDNSGLSYSGPIQTNQFGMANFWVAQYPYRNGMTVQQAKNLNLHARAAAWQFTSSAKLLPSHPYFDLNLDYTGRFTK